MKTTTPLTGAHQRTFDRIFQHPISHNLEWRDVHALLEEMGDVAKEHNGSLKVTRNNQILILHPTSKKDVTEMDEIMKLRHFLERSEATPSSLRRDDIISKVGATTTSLLQEISSVIWMGREPRRIYGVDTP